MDDDDEIALVGRIRTGYQGFLAEWKKAQWHEPAADMPIAKTRQDVVRLNDDLAANSLLAPAKELLALEERLIHKSGGVNQDMAGWVAVFLWLLGICGAVAGLVAGFGIARGISSSIVNLYVPIRAASGRLEEVIGPVDIAPARGIEHLDEILRSMADHVGTVVDRLQQTQHEILRAEQMSALGQLAAGPASQFSDFERQRARAFRGRCSVGDFHRRASRRSEPVAVLRHAPGLGAKSGAPIGPVIQRQPDGGRSCRGS